MAETSREMRSGQFDSDAVADYRAEQIGDTLIERVIWGERPRLDCFDTTIAAPGYIWYRFWIAHTGQVVERYYAPDGQPVGTLVDLCLPVIPDTGGYRARDLVLDLWIAPDGRVTLHNEAEFEKAVREGALSNAEAEQADAYLRALTAAIAQDRFPPPLVRNWQLDMNRIRETTREAVGRGANDNGTTPVDG